MLGFQPLSTLPVSAQPAVPLSTPHDDYNVPEGFRRVIDTSETEQARRDRLAAIRRDIGLDKEPDAPIAPLSEIVVAPVAPVIPTGPSFDVGGYTEAVAEGIRESVLAAEQAEAEAVAARVAFVVADDERVLMLLAMVV